MAVPPALHQPELAAEDFTERSRIVTTFGRPLQRSGPPGANVPMITWPPGATGPRNALGIGGAIFRLRQEMKGRAVVPDIVVSMFPGRHVLDDPSHFRATRASLAAAACERFFRQVEDGDGRETGIDERATRRDAPPPISMIGAPGFTFVARKIEGDRWTFLNQLTSSHSLSYRRSPNGSVDRGYHHRSISLGCAHAVRQRLIW